jgi:hypothetical protein
LKKKADMATMGGHHSKGKNKSVLPGHEVEALARCFLPAIREYYETEEGKSAFAEWKREHSGAGAGTPKP